ncbi:hypothetical protein M5689_023797 [Euphorbia peplus]|nr:hypothetical protein M5689_023797 [Euphorbia peplus]
MEIYHNKDLQNPNNGKSHPTDETLFSTDDFDSTCSTPYVSAPSSPGRAPSTGGFYYSCPASPMHFAMTGASVSYSASAVSSPERKGYEFEFSARLAHSGSGHTGSMSSADELFLNGQIRPMKLSTHLERPQMLAPLIDLENEDDDEEDNVGRIRGRDLRLRDKSVRRRSRSMSPLRSNSFEYEEDGKKSEICNKEIKIEEDEEVVTPSVSASSSRSSSAGRNSKRWVFLKDFLYRSKSEGRSNNKFWSNISFSPAKEKKPLNTTQNQNQKMNAPAPAKGSSQNVKKPVNGVGKRRIPTSPHELHYKASKAQAEEMRKKTFLPYRQGLLGCLGFSSKGYGAMNGFARALNPVSSR